MINTSIRSMQINSSPVLHQFEKEFKRYEATRDYHNAFLYCLVNLQSDIYCTIAMNKALALIENYSYLLFEKHKRVYRFVIDKKLDKNWLVDALINQGINDMGTASMSIGYTYVFNRINCYHFENLFSSCNIGMVQNGNSSIIYYDFSVLRNNHDIVKAVCKEIIKLYL